MQQGRFAGVDWASEEHAACVVEESGRILEGRRYGHDERGITALCERLLKLEVTLVAIERPDGLLIDRLLDAGLAVIAVHPNQVCAMRPRFSAAGGKSDDFDSFVLAELARTDSHRFRVLVPDSDQTKALRAMTRAREDLVAARVALANELRAQLQCFWPGAAKIFAQVDSPIALAFLARYPSPMTRADSASSASPASLPATATAPSAPRASCSPGCATPPRAAPARSRATRDARSCSASWPRSHRWSPRSAMTRQISAALDEHPDAATFRSLFKDPSSVVTAATMLAEIGDSRERYPTYRALAADGGQAPVAVESGKSKRARFRWACDHRLRDAIATMADASRHHNPWATDIYQRARARGVSHPHAIRILGRAWCQIIWRLWQDHAAYDPDQHTARRQLSAAT